MANKKTREREINAAKVKVYENKKNSLKILSPISIAIIAVTVLLMFVPFIEIMNDPSRAGQTGAAFVEQEGANGFTCLIIALTRDYTSAESALSPYYYWITTQGGQPFVQMLTLSSLVALLASVLAAVADIIVIATKKHEFVLFALACDFVAAAAFIMAFAAALCCKEKMIAGYCSGNVACYIRSFAIIPAICALGALVTDAIHFVNYNSIEKKA